MPLWLGPLPVPAPCWYHFLKFVLVIGFSLTIPFVYVLLISLLQFLFILYFIVFLIASFLQVTAVGKLSNKKKLIGIYCMFEYHISLNYYYYYYYYCCCCCV